MFTNDFWGNSLISNDSHKSFRPLTTLSFTLQRHINGVLSSRSMKTVNLLIHTSNCCLLFVFFKAILSDMKKAHLYAILMFSVHPIHVEAVCGIVSRSDLMACFVFLLSGTFYFNVFYKGKHGFDLVSTCLWIKLFHFLRLKILPAQTLFNADYYRHFNGDWCSDQGKCNHNNGEFRNWNLWLLI